MNWVDALTRFQHTTAASVLDPLLARLRPGQQVLFVRPMTEGAQGWKAPWTQLVRRRSAQWGDALSTDSRLVRVAAAPAFYRPEAADIAMHAVVYVKH
jgi:hypothetical protein